MTTAAIIVAAGRGLRAGGGTPKQWRPLAGRRVADWALETFRTQPEVDSVTLVLHPEDMGMAGEFPQVRCVTGGASRGASVRAGLEALDGSGVTRVLVHDAARPLASRSVIGDILRALDVHDAAAPGLELSDALWRASDGRVVGTADRRGLVRAQTPQGFRYEAILSAHRAHAGSADDDVEVARAAGLDVAVVPGDERNLKITRPEDFERAEALMGKTAMDVRTGNGFDVHRFGPGGRVILCGVDLPHDRGLVGHSDADVAMHASTDALLGALAEGDIGRHFPPDDPRWKGAASRIFLQRAVELATERGYAIGNLDVTIVCERPKIGPHAAEMAANMAAIMNVSADRVSVKATTTERLGFAGREEGIAAMATATLARQ